MSSTCQKEYHLQSGGLIGPNSSQGNVHAEGLEPTARADTQVYASAGHLEPTGLDRTVLEHVPGAPGGAVGCDAEYAQPPGRAPIP